MHVRRGMDPHGTCAGQADNNLLELMHDLDRWIGQLLCCCRQALINIVGLEEKVVAKGFPGYDDLMEQQYAYSSHSDDMAPLFIIKPQDEEDIIQVLRFAAEKNYRVAVRTGGHQYSGASSVSPQHGGCQAEKWSRIAFFCDRQSMLPSTLCHRCILTNTYDLSSSSCSSSFSKGQTLPFGGPPLSCVHNSTALQLARLNIVA